MSEKVICCHCLISCDDWNDVRPVCLVLKVLQNFSRNRKKNASLFVAGKYYITGEQIHAVQMVCSIGWRVKLLESMKIFHLITPERCSEAMLFWWTDWPDFGSCAQWETFLLKVKSLSHILCSLWSSVHIFLPCVMRWYSSHENAAAGLERSTKSADFTICSHRGGFNTTVSPSWIWSKDKYIHTLYCYSFNSDNV